MKSHLATLAAAAVLALALCLAGCKQKTQTPEAGPTGQPPIKIGAIFAITGPAANLGAPEDKTARMVVDKLNAAGGINGRKIELIVKDSAGEPPKALSFAKQLIEEDKVLAIIGPSTTGDTMAIKTLCQEGQTILISCAAAEKIVDPVLSYVFKVAPKDSDAAKAIYQVMKDKGIAKIGVISSNDNFGQGGSEQLTKYAKDYGITIAISEAYDKQDNDLTGVLTKVKGQNVQAVVNWSAVPAQANVATNMKQIGLDVPLFQSHGYGNIKYVKGEAVNGTIFPCGRILVADALPDDHPQKKLLIAYKTDYEGQYKEDTSTFGGHAYDAVTLLAEAIKKAGSTDSAKVREALENLKGVVGTAGVFTFTPQDHNGLGIDAFEMLTVKDGKFAIYKPVK